ncbi:uncharacterized protein Tco025E_04174 [Trypanosoma conorhini]|uniref:Uncharacterized protein n=1 Tax=Trypanosoma conorhini TaxID=83891 RepID=A0A422PNR0_9TRYP|nr:uncharacterized protein Tco025E_04174 [Trypanosoma conorhini]RNF19363.1 hypothetical protein Tco025E_04174 [Trypanosoma conorhini]
MSSQWANSKAGDEAVVRRRLLRFYENHNPRKLNSIETILFAYRGHWDELFLDLAEKYKLSSQQPDTATHGCSSSSHRSPPAGHDASLDDFSCSTSGGFAGSSAFGLLDPMEVVQRRRNDTKRSDIRQGSITALHDDKKKKIRRAGDSTSSSFSLPGVAQESIVRRLRLQQLFMRLAPKEVLRMEEFMAQYREAYMMDAHCGAGGSDSAAEDEWEEAMMRDLLHEVNREKSKGDGHCANSSLEELHLELSPPSFASRVLFPFTSADSLELKSPLGTRQLHGFHATETSTPEPGTRERRSTTKGPAPSPSQSSVTPNVDELMHSRLETSVDEWCEPPGGNATSNTAESLLTLKAKQLTPANSASTISVGHVAAGEENAGLCKNVGESPLLFSMLSRNTHGERVCMLFSQTREERQAERLLAHSVMRRLLACPHFHYRLFLLICIALERAQGGIVPPQRETFMTASKGEEQMPCWEPSLRHRLLWRGSSPRDEYAFLLPRDSFAKTLPDDLLDTLHTSRSLVHAVGLGLLWRDEVTFADVVAVRMRYFTRRYSTIRWLVQRTFATLRGGQEGVQHPRRKGSPWQSGDTLDSLFFIDVVKELRRFVRELSEGCWAELIASWKMEHHLKGLISALQDECDSRPGPSDTSAVRCGGLEESEGEVVTAGRDGRCREKRLPRGVVMLLSCTAFLCLHVEQPLAGISRLDVAATYHCLCVAAIAEEESHRRRTTLQGWGEEYDNLHRMERQSVARVSMQQRERRQRGIVELDEFSTWMRLLQSVCSRISPRSPNYFGSRGALSSHPHSPSLHEDPVSTIAEAALLPSPLPKVAMAAAAAEASVSQSSLPWRGEAMQQRLNAFFRRKSEHQQRHKQGRQADLAAALLQP